MWISPLIGVLAGFALLNPPNGISLRDLAVVGWVERSETHHLVRQEAILMGFVSLNPSYPLSERRAIRRVGLLPQRE